MTARIALGVALAALVLSTAGTGYAVTRIAAKSVGSRALKDGAVRSVAVKDGTLRAADLRPGLRAALRPGPTGPQGSTGAAGPAGPTGPQGPAGVVATLGVESSAIAPSLPANTRLAPESCRTGSHLAQAGEVAMVDVAVSLLPTMAANAVLYGSLAVSEDDGGFTSESVEGIEGLNDGVASVAVSARVPLTAGVRYRFGVVVESSSALNVVKSSCHVTAMIVRA